ncbi:MAG: hypothetical protein GX270_04090 [Clostridiaceae bacterium]|jgi:hypothetical protein|nr:hypothetical protein [Clostridiaceae bacterium]
MSKLTNVFLSLLLALCLCQIIGVASSGNVVFAEEFVYGDINGDQEVDSLDFALMRQHILGIIKDFETDNGIKAADVDGNGDFDSIDFACMRKYLLGLIKVFPVNQRLTPTPTPSPTSEFEDAVISSDIVLEEDRTYRNLVLEEGATIDLNGYALYVKGDFLQNEGNVIINSGSLNIDNNHTIYEEGMLQMTNEADYVYVGGNFTTNSAADHSEYLTAGTLEVKGDFTQSNNPLNFAATGAHKTILSGDTVQNITFESPATSFFNILQLTKPFDTGYIFNATPVWRTLEN